MSLAAPRATGSILDARLLRLMREQERKVEQVVADAKQRQRL
jgi:hypothetical protein